MLLHFIKGRLPWQGISGKSREDQNNNIRFKKTELTPAKLCEGLPYEFQEYFEQCRDLAFTQTPNYYGFGRLFLSCLVRIEMRPHRLERLKTLMRLAAEEKPDDEKNQENKESK